jgi:hypothetical protein
MTRVKGPGETQRMRRLPLASSARSAGCCGRRQLVTRFTARKEALGLCFARIAQLASEHAGRTWPRGISGRQRLSNTSRRHPMLHPVASECTESVQMTHTDYRFLHFCVFLRFNSVRLPYQCEPTT